MEKLVLNLWKRGFKVKNIAAAVRLSAAAVTSIIDKYSTMAMINKLISMDREDEITLPLSYNLRSTINRWDDEMKGDMMGEFIYAARQGINLLDSLDVLVNEHFPVWIDEADQEQDKERKEILEGFKTRFQDELKIEILKYLVMGVR